MPGYRGHIVGALILWVISIFVCSLWYTASISEFGEWGCALVLGALFPDLDTKSMGQKWLYRILFVLGSIFIIAGRYRWAALMLLVASIPLMMPHRGMLHSR